MKLKLPKHILDRLVTALEDDVEDALDYLRNLDVANVPIDEIITARDGLASARSLLESVRQLKAGQEVELNVTTKTLTFTPYDNRPNGWEKFIAFFVPSRSGGKGHEITMSGVSGNRSFSCNCKAATFGNDCWAKDSVARMMRQSDTEPWREYSLMRARVEGWMLATDNEVTPVKVLDNVPSDFGLIGKIDVNDDLP